MIRPVRPAHRIDVAGKTIESGTVFIIAEMACAHDGDFGKAVELISAASDAGVDAVQLQIFHSHANVVEHHSLRPVLEKIEFDAEQWGALVAASRELSLPVFACAYDMPSLELALKLRVDGIKFNSADLGNREMLEMAAKSDTFFTLGTGASRFDEIGDALSTVLETGGTRVALMHGIQAFPTRIEKADIRRVALLGQSFDALVGYADHTDGDSTFAGEIDLLAVGAGASILEKHFTLNRADKGIDYQAALNPDQLTSYVRRMRDGVRAIGNGTPRRFDDDDLRYRRFQKKRIVARRLLPEGTVITRSDIDLLRCEDGEGMSAAAMQTVIGRTLRRAIERHALVRPEFLEQTD